MAATPDREIKRKWSISASTDYLNKTNKDNYMVRSNPIGLVEPSVKRDGYAVGSKEGSVYRSSGNLNISKGSRAGSEVREDKPSKSLRFFVFLYQTFLLLNSAFQKYLLKKPVKKVTPLGKF